jgi:pyridine nucleotide-disulfide oxidoreductase family protein
MKHLILVGGGHAHVYLLIQLQYRRRPDTRITLISPDRYQYYSGMFSGYVEGKYGLDEFRIDLLHLCKQANVDFIVASAESLEPKKQEILISNGERIRYDLISFNIGSRNANDMILGLQGSEAFIKPNFRVPKIKDTLAGKERIVVVGGGASGIEMSLSLQANHNRMNRNTPVTLVHSGRLLESYGTRASRLITNIVQNKGVRLIQNNSVISLHENQMILESGSRILFDGLLWLTGPSAPKIFQDSDLRTDAPGYLLVNDHLQSVSYPNIFGAGDCIGIQSHLNLRKAGVYAVREAPILWFNLQRFMDGGALKRYRPQSDYLSILSTGNEEALLLYRGLTFHGRWCWKLKRRIDTSFIRKYQLTF